MRVAFFLGSFPEISETFILRQITGLIDLGHEVDIYADGRPKEDTGAVHTDVIKYKLLDRTTYMSDHMPPESGYWEMPVWPISGETWLPDADASIPNRERAENAAPFLIHCLTQHPKLAFEVLDVNEYGMEAASLSALYRLFTLSNRPAKYDVLHAHFGPNGNCFRFARELWKAPFIVTFHGYDMCTIPRQKGQDVYQRLFVSADVITVHSTYARKLMEKLKCPPQKIKRLNVGVDLQEFSFRPRAFQPGEKVKILSVARLVEIKGLDFALRAMAKVRKEFPDIHYDIVGEGPERNKLESLIRELGLDSIVELHGAKDSNYVKRMMDSAHIFVLPSIVLNGDQEGTPVSLMEAQASGIPVIASNTGGISEVILPGVSGFLFQEKDFNELACRISDLIKSPVRWPDIGQAGRMHVEKNYDIKILSESLVEIYNESIANFLKN